MARKEIPPSVMRSLLVNAGGRCEFEGCNKLLTVDRLTTKAQNSAVIAHVVAASESGPRGESKLTDEERSSIDNLMLLCYECHRRIDNEQKDIHTVKKLLAMKESHEKRIKRATSIDKSLTTHLLLFSTPIQKRPCHISVEEAKNTVLISSRYPQEDIFEIKGNELGCDEDNSKFMERVNDLTCKKLGTLINNQESITGQSVTSLSVLALGTIPALLNLGYLLGDLTNVDIYQKKRDGSWIWDAETVGVSPHEYFKLEYPSAYEEEVAVNISLSGIITTEKMYTAISKEIPACYIKIEDSHFNFLHTKSQFEHFERSWNLLLSETRKQKIKKIHLFCAIPCSLAVMIGRSIHKKIDPKILIYDLCSSGDDYEWKWTINERS